MTSQITSDVWDEPRQAALIVQLLNGDLSLAAACERHGLSRETVRSWVPIHRHRTLQALDEKLLQASLLESVNAERFGNAAYTGGFDDLPVSDLLQTCQMGNKDAVITVMRGSQQSSIWCERGAVVDAESGRLRGAAAVYRILAFDSGQVSAHFRIQRRPRTVELPCHMLLLEAARHKDECARLLARLNGSRSIFQQAPGAWAADTTLTERQVMCLCDGERAVTDVLEASELSDLETLSTLTGLVGRGYLLRDGISTPPPPVASGPAASNWGKTSNVYLSLSPAALPVTRSHRSAPWLVALIVLGVLLWFGVETLYGGLRFL